MLKQSLIDGCFVGVSIKTVLQIVKFYTVVNGEFFLFKTGNWFGGHKLAIAKFHVSL